MPTPPPEASFKGMRLATIRGVPVYVGSSWAILALIIVALTGPDIARSRPDLGVLAYGVAMLYAVMLLVAVLVHEAAHAVTARGFDYPVHRVVADLWGGHTALDVTKASPGRSALVALAGPAANGLLALVGFGLTGVLPDGVPGGLAAGFGWLNGALALFNLLPGLPLDGGQLVEAGVWGATGSRARARVAAGSCGLVVTVTVVAVAVGVPLLRGETPSLFTLGWSLMIAWFLWQGARAAIAVGKGNAQIERLRVLDVLTPVAAFPMSARLADFPSGLAPVLVDDAGVPIALVDAEALARIPPQAYPHTLASAVSRRQPPHWVLEVDPSAALAEILPTLAAVGTGVVAVCQKGQVLGVVTIATVNGAAAHR